jgi:hypothetical protein
MRLTEDKRQNLIAKSKASTKGMQRYKRRSKSHVASVVKSFNSIDMNKLFKQDILTVNVPVQGETDDYVVRITFGGFLEIIQDSLKDGHELSFRDVSRAAIIGFNRDDVYINCTCPDFNYRFAYHATQNKVNSGAPETRPSNITNPGDTLGSGCKHILLVLNNNSWIIRVARVIVNYVKYMEKHYPKLYADIIYPALYGKEYEEPVQLDIEDETELISDNDTDTLDAANAYNKDRTQFQKGNEKGIRFASEPKEDPDQLEIENEDDIL